MSETDDKEKAQGDAEFVRSKLHVEWGYYHEDDGGDERIFAAVPKTPLVQAGYREPPFEVRMWDGRVRHIVEREL
jgi:hypothetical protein